MSGLLSRLFGHSGVKPPSPIYGSKVYRVGIVGESRRQSAIRRAKAGEAVRLVHEEGNPHDARAIQVLSRRGEQLGYLPRDGWLTEVLLDQRQAVRATIASIARPAGVPHLAVVLEVRW